MEGLAPPAAGNLSGAAGNMEGRIQGTWRGEFKEHGEDHFKTQNLRTKKPKNLQNPKNPKKMKTP
jgi:hypothetical protein